MTRMTVSASVGIALAVLTATAQARVTRIEITRQEPFAGGVPYGNTGAYEKIVGRFRGELDPAHPLNAAIVDIDNAPRTAQGMVEYSADFYILKPLDLGQDRISGHDVEGPVVGAVQVGAVDHDEDTLAPLERRRHPAGRLGERGIPARADLYVVRHPVAEFNAHPVVRVMCSGPQ